MGSWEKAEAYVRYIQLQFKNIFILLAWRFRRWLINAGLLVQAPLPI